MWEETQRDIREQLRSAQACEAGIHTEVVCRSMIDRLLHGDPYATFGVPEAQSRAATYGTVDRLWDTCRTRLGIMTLKNGAVGIGAGPCLRGMVTLATELRMLAHHRARLLVAPGHPGSLVGFYTAVIDAYVTAGGSVCTLDKPLPLDPPYFVDAVGPVSVITNTAGLFHTHDTRPCDLLLDALRPDAVLADHGFAGAALYRALPTLCPVDCDDAALAIPTSDLPLSIFPMNDNAPNVALTRAGDIVQRLLGDPRLCTTLLGTATLP